MTHGSWLSDGKVRLHDRQCFFDAMGGDSGDEGAFVGDE